MDEVDIGPETVVIGIEQNAGVLFHNRITPGRVRPFNDLGQGQIRNDDDKNYNAEINEYFSYPHLVTFHIF